MAIALLTVTLSSIQPAFAHEDPAECGENGGNGANTQVALFREGVQFGGAAVQGETIEMVITVEKTAACGLDGGAGDVGGDGTDFELPNSTTGHEDFGCIGGTEDDGDNIGDIDCGDSPTSEVVFDSIFYDVDCNDATEVDDGVFRLIWSQSTSGQYHDQEDDIGPSTFLKEDNIQRVCELPPYDFDTSADPADQIVAGPLNGASDDVDISGLDGLAGEFDVTAVLAGPDGDHAATCNSVASAADDHEYPVTSTCTTTDVLTEPGQYCWNVDVDEQTGNYDPSQISKDGIDDETNECFNIENEYDFDTLAENADQTVAGPLNGASDDVDIDAEDGVPGEFDVTAVLAGPDGDHAATCNSVASAADDHLYPITSTCTTTDVLTVPGQYCWNVDVDEQTGNFDPSQVSKDGIDDETNECFEIVVGDFNGCTPGYWKANYDNRDAVNWFDGANPDSLIKTVFSSADGDLDKDPSADTVRDALSYKGGGGLEGAERILLRAASAAWLNIGTGAFDYEFGTEAQLIAAVNAAIDSGSRSDMLNLASVLDAFNNAEDDEGIHCPLDNSNQQVD
jgi:hypothetical protein